MSRASQQALMVKEAQEYLLKNRLTTGGLIDLLNIGFRHGAVWKADQVQPIISRLEGIEVDLEPAATFQSGPN